MSASRGADLAAALGVLALPWLLYGSVVGLWWSHDDFVQLRFAVAHSPADYFLDPEVWRLLPNRVLSPLLFASYDLDLALAGLEPSAFYAHQLLSLGALALALYILLRRRHSPVFAGCAAGLFLLGPPIAASAPLLMVRHYPESLALGLLSAAIFAAAVRRRGPAAWCGSALSAVLYLAASLAKEIAVPLPALLALVPGTPLRRLVLLLLPHAGALGVYAAYRTWMLGSPLGGYGWVARPGERLEVALALPGAIADELAGASAAGRIVVAALLAAACIFAAADRRRALLLVVGAGAALFPVLFVAVEVEPRFALAPWLLLVLAATPGAPWTPATRPGRSAALLALLLVAGSAAVANRRAWIRHSTGAVRASVEYRGLLEMEAGDLLRRPVGPPASTLAFRGFARELLGTPIAGDFFYDDFFLCPRSGDSRTVRRIWEFDRESRRLRSTPGGVEELRRRSCSSIRWKAPLEARFEWDGRVLSWDLGPRSDGRYAILHREGRIRHDVPASGAYHFARLDPGPVRIRYEAPEGWVTYSPPLRLRATPGFTRRWRRP